MHSKPSPLGGERKDQKMKLETEILLERFGRYCMWHLPSLEEYVSEAQETKEIKMATTREQIHELLDLVLDINGLESRTRETTGSKPTAFFEFSGHTAEVSVDVHTSGWDAGCKPEFRKSVYIERNDAEALLNKLRKIRDGLGGKEENGDRN
jgi:hypothetical protein